MEKQQAEENEDRNEIFQLLQNKEFTDLVTQALKLGEKFLELKNGQFKEQMSLDKEKLSYEKEKLTFNAKSYEQGRGIAERLTVKYLWFNGILFFLSLLAVGILGYLKVIPDAVAGTILAGMIGYIFGKGPRRSDDERKQ